MTSGSGEGMVVVVPSFTQRQDTDNRIVAAVIMAFIGLAAPDMADRVDAPGDMMLEEDPDETTPEEPGEGTEPCAADDTAENCWNDETQQYPEWEQITDQLQILVGSEIGDVSSLVGLFDPEQPAEVGIHESLYATAISDMR